MATKVILFLVLIFASTGALSQGGIGHAIVRLSGDGTAFLITEVPPKDDDNVFIQYPDSNSQPLCCKKMSTKAFVVDRSAPFVAINVVDGEPAIISRAQVPMEWASKPFIGAAGIGEIYCARSSTNGGLTLKDKVGQTTRSETCVSQEGFHLLEQIGKTTRDRLYLGFGYEVEATSCNE